MSCLCTPPKTAERRDYASPEGLVDDPERIVHLDAYLRLTDEAIARGADLRGYFLWSLLFRMAHRVPQRLPATLLDPTRPYSTMTPVSSAPPAYSSREAAAICVRLTSARPKWLMTRRSANERAVTSTMAMKRGSGVSTKLPISVSANSRIVPVSVWPGVKMTSWRGTRSISGRSMPTWPVGAEEISSAVWAMKVISS